MPERSLAEIFLANGGRQINKWLHYFDIYERHFARFRGQAPVMLEIGVLGGGSLQMWKEYFGPGAQIVGLDINPECADFAGEGVEVVIGSQDDASVLDALLERHAFDIVLDDGSHMMKHMRTSFAHLYGRIAANGVYMLEDLHCCYFDGYDGGLKREGTFIEIVKERIDQLHAQYAKGLKPDAFTRETGGIHIYDSIVAFERAPQGERQKLRTGAMGTLNMGKAKA
jgi:SAM-dependent methyltransferase